MALKLEMLAGKQITISDGKTEARILGTGSTKASICDGRHKQRAHLTLKTEAKVGKQVASVMGLKLQSSLRRTGEEAESSISDGTTPKSHL